MSSRKEKVQELVKSCRETMEKISDLFNEWYEESLVHCPKSDKEEMLGAFMNGYIAGQFMMIEEEYRKNQNV